MPVLPLAAMTNDEPPARPRRKRSLALRFGASFVLGLLLTVGVGAGVLYAWGQQYDSRILPGVRIGSTDLSGLTREQAEAEIANAYGSFGTGQITLDGPDGPATISYADVGRGPDTTALIDAALAAGRQGEPFANLIGSPQAAIHGVTLNPAVRYDRDKLTAAVETLATTIDQTPVDASVSAGQGGTYSVSPAKDGRAVDKAALSAALDQQLAALDAPASITVPVPVVSLAPAVSTASAETAKAAADRMAADVVIARGKDSWTITGKSLAPLISFSTAADGRVTPVVDWSGLDPMVTKLAKKVNQTPQDAGLKMVGGHVVATGTSREGRTLNVDRMKAEIIGEIMAREAGAAATPVAAVVKAVKPKLTTADAKAFAAKMRPISSYSVFYWVIVNNHWGGNIEAPATKINGTVVPAGTMFDFWKVVGDLRKLPGTGPGNAIEGGKITVTGAFGGGICTTSTTLFNAAFRAGMVPLARAEPQRVHHPVSGGPRRHRVDRRQYQADDELQERHQVPDPDHAERQQRRRQAMAHVQDLERAERTDRQGHQHGHPARPARDPQDREGSDQARGVPVLQQRPGGRRQGVDHRVDLRPRQAPLEQAVLLELPGRGRRHRGGDRLTPGRFQRALSSLTSASRTSPMTRSIGAATASTRIVAEPASIAL